MRKERDRLQVLLDGVRECSYAVTRYTVVDVIKLFLEEI